MHENQCDSFENCNHAQNTLAFNSPAPPSPPSPSISWCSFSKYKFALLHYSFLYTRFIHPYFASLVLFLFHKVCFYPSAPFVVFPSVQCVNETAAFTRFLLFSVPWALLEPCLFVVVVFGALCLSCSSLRSRRTSAVVQTTSRQPWIVCSMPLINKGIIVL